MNKDGFLKQLSIPIIVVIVTAAIGLGIDWYKTSRKVTIIIEGPFSFANLQELLGNAQVNVTWWGKDKPKPNPEPEKPRDPRVPAVPKLGIGVEMNLNELQIYKVTVRNTGSSPLKELPVRLVFEDASTNFSVYAIQHKTNPPQEFGEIKTDSNISSPRFVYQLLNPGDEDVITVLASEKRELKVYARGEGVSLDVRRAGEDRSAWSILLITSALAGMILGIITTFLGWLLGRRRGPPEIFRQ
jgi:hypothetical protein